MPPFNYFHTFKCERHGPESSLSYAAVVIRDNSCAGSGRCGFQRYRISTSSFSPRSAVKPWFPHGAFCFFMQQNFLSGHIRGSAEKFMRSLQNTDAKNWAAAVHEAHEAGPSSKFAGCKQLFLRIILPLEYYGIYFR